ncbi:platelet endothelial aggregation receptor 1-like [Mya arenaria]|uniref:platelet endothelial aggregation receptor 1-like n=1 Tax=Mya arenaria TaxID=6604 RepID=UPI0022E2D5BD|nr:platelet endothelial aggregation receptor 1-like [Mya arenaria]
MKAEHFSLRDVFFICACLLWIITVSSGKDIIAKNDTIAVYQSSTYDKCYASNVVNNMTLHTLVVPDSTLCLTCSATGGNESPWLQIDFGRKTMMRNLRIFGRDYDTPGQSSNLLVSISNTSHFLNQNFSTWEDFGWINASDPYRGIMWDLGVNRVLQYLVFRRPWPSVMAICEVAVFNTDCEKGSFGDKCESMCHCKDEQPCDSVTGKCSTPGCYAGWKEDSCSTQCSGDEFGVDCSSTCHCYDNGVCDSINGTCICGECALGWQGNTCDIECTSPHFGQNCGQTCHCYTSGPCEPINGLCTHGMCAPGWLADSCDKECDYGRFGQNCSNSCHCYDSASCNPTDGICSNNLCETGWQGDSCSEVCGFGHFGRNCSQICHCYDNASCDPFSGLCPNSKCSNGWQGPSCNIEAGTSNASTILTTKTPITEVTTVQIVYEELKKYKSRYIVSVSTAGVLAFVVVVGLIVVCLKSGGQSFSSCCWLFQG